MWMNSFLEPAALLEMKFYLGIFQGICLKVLKDVLYRTPTLISSVTYSVGYDGGLRRL